MAIRQSLIASSDPLLIGSSISTGEVGVVRGQGGMIAIPYSSGLVFLLECCLLGVNSSV
jgi:hypothetical protein